MDYEEFKRIEFDDGDYDAPDPPLRPERVRGSVVFAGPPLHDNLAKVVTDEGVVRWMVPETPYVVIVPAVNRPNDWTSCHVYGPYGWLEAGRVADRLGGYARSVVKET